MKRAQVIVLCEDKQHSVFTYRFLKHRTNHRIRVIAAPPAGDCKTHVRALIEMCTVRELRDPAPPSLIAACDEYRRVLA